MVLVVHPDKNPNDPQAGEKFIKLTNAYNILIDDEKRQLYDETGEYDENEAGPVDLDDTYNYYRSIYPKIRLEDIETFSNKYRGSDMEKEDLINFYKENNGDITLMLEVIPLSRNEDVERFIKIYENLIKEKKIKKTKLFTSSKKSVKLLEDNEEEIEEAEGNLKELEQQIMLKKKKRNENNFLSHLAGKYGGGQNFGENEDIDEEEFQKIQKKMMKKKNKNN